MRQQCEILHIWSPAPIVPSESLTIFLLLTNCTVSLSTPVLTVLYQCAWSNRDHGHRLTYILINRHSTHTLRRYIHPHPPPSFSQAGATCLAKPFPCLRPFPGPTFSAPSHRQRHRCIDGSDHGRHCRSGGHHDRHVDLRTDLCLCCNLCVHRAHCGRGTI